MDPMGKGFVAVAHLRKTQGGPPTTYKYGY